MGKAAALPFLFVMIMYTVPAGTRAIVYNVNWPDVDDKFVTTKENNFTETVNDPIALHNGRLVDGYDSSSIFNPNYYARNGYYVFRREDWMMAVSAFYVTSA